MAKQTINVGAAPNDGTGDPARTAFTKCNANFTELYAAGGGNVSNSGTPAAGQWARWVTATTIEGVAAASTGFVQKAGDTMTGILTVTESSGENIILAGSNYPAIHWTPAAGATKTTYAYQQADVFRIGSNTADIVLVDLAAGVASLNATPAAGDNSTKIATTAFVAAAAGGGVGTSAVRGLVGNASSTTAYAITFTEAVLRNAAGACVFVTNGSFTADSAGAVGANGRDATLADGDLHLYAIKGAGAVAGIWSNTAPPTGPTLPSGYTHWCYLSSVKRAGSVIATMIMRGDRVSYSIKQTMFENNTVTGITSAFDYSALVPALAIDVDFFTMTVVVSGSGALALGQWDLGIISGSSLFHLYNFTENMSNYSYETGYVTLPNVNRTVFFGWTSIVNPLSFGGHLYLTGYRVPNGGS